MTPLIIGIIVVVVLAVIFIVIYNKLVKLNIRAEEAWSDITVQLKRRYDLIPNLINTVKGYATHERQVFEQVTAARANALNAQGVQQTAQAEGDFQKTLKSLFAVAEAYPDLKANENFKALQDELVDTEDKIQASRRFYNGVVRDFNTARTVLPGNLIAGMMGFKKDREFFELDDAQTVAVQNPVQVQF
ncbi:MAG TPA: LemA family protein [Candidatus Saccharimonadales bacterium]|nr:LemA family protein [Candidatus Saccharimonadales bacterium]